MNLNSNYIKQIEEIVGKDNIKTDEVMRKHTSFKVGGPADVMVYPVNFNMVKNLISFFKTNNINYYVMGNGSNLIIKDGGFRGVVINLTKLNEITVNDDTIIAQCGALLSLVARRALEKGLTDLEFAAGIPGSIGGAIAMNAGAYDGDMSKVVVSALVIDDNGEILELSRDELQLSYRNSIVLNKGYVVLETKLKLHHGDAEAIKAKMNDFAERRRSKQPLEYPSAGSTFKRPEGYFAGKLIQDAGLKGKSVGDAQVSEKHSGFIINKGNATAREIMELINVVQNTVFDMYGVELHTEVRIVGEDNNN
ncbi:MAG: UDP-N-acetylmuramate dehydrogenase [Clostridium sp.]|nr:UDP-N-acetylmuramate dehydrogenase [Clostridium sp.]